NRPHDPVERLLSPRNVVAHVYYAHPSLLARIHRGTLLLHTVARHAPGHCAISHSTSCPATIGLRQARRVCHALTVDGLHRQRHRDHARSHAMFGGINPRHAPVPWLPLPFLLSAPLALAAGHLLLAVRAQTVLGSYRSTSAIAVTHLLVLGFVVATM